MRKEVFVKDGHQYISVSCDHCGLVMQRYEALEWTEKVEVGESSGSTRSSWSSGSGFSSRLKVWFSLGSGGSISSGGKLYRMKKVYLCPQCYAKVDKEPPPKPSTGLAVFRALLSMRSKPGEK